MLKRLRTMLMLLESRNFPELGLEMDALKTEDDGKIYSELKVYFSGNRFDEMAGYLLRCIRSHTMPAKAEITLSGLRTQIRMLETQISVAHHKKAEILKSISQFRVRHNSELGMIMSRILKLQADVLFHKMQSDSKLEPEYRQARTESGAFRRSRLQLKKQNAEALGEDQKIRLKKLFRDASKWCHPDLAPDELKEQASRVFMELNNAYFYNDLKKVEEIYQMLCNRKLFAVSDPSEGESERMEARAERLKSELYRIQTEVVELQNSPVYSTLSRIRDWDVYFQELKTRFENEYHQLRKEYEQIRGSSNF